MPIVVVGGSGKDVGKTALVCAMIAELREFEWTAVKITAHDYEPEGAVRVEESVICEKTNGVAGGGMAQTDTARYLEAGARRALLVTRSGAEIPMGEIRRALGGDRNVIYESNRIVDVVEPDVCVALVAGARTDWKSSFVRLLKKADAVVCCAGAEIAPEMRREGVARFEWKAGEPLSEDMAAWLRERLLA